MNDQTATTSKHLLLRFQASSKDETTPGQNETIVFIIIVIIIDLNPREAFAPRVQYTPFVFSIHQVPNLPPCLYKVSCLSCSRIVVIAFAHAARNRDALSCFDRHQGAHVLFFTRTTSNHHDPRTPALLSTSAFLRSIVMLAVLLPRKVRTNMHALRTRLSRSPMTVRMVHGLGKLRNATTYQKTHT